MINRPHPPLRRFLALSLSLTLLASGLPQSLAHARPAPHSPLAASSGNLIDFLVQGLFEDARPDRYGNRRARFHEGANSFDFYHAPDGGTFRRRLHVFVDEGASQLQVTLLTDSRQEGDVRLRLISPSGEAIVPGRVSSGRYASLTPLDDLLRQSPFIAPAARRSDSDADLPRRSLRLKDQPVGTQYRNSSTDEVFVNLQAPEPGDWTVHIVAHEAGELLLSTAVQATPADDALASTKLLYQNGCTIAVKFLIGTVKIVFGALLLAKLGFVGAVVALELAVLEMAVLLAEVTVDTLVAFGVVSKKSGGLLNLIPASLEIVTKIDVLGSAIKGVFSAVLSAFGRKGTEAFARAVCKAIGLKKLLAFDPVGIQGLAQAGATYRDQVKVINSTGRVTFSLASGTLPPTFDLNSKSGTIQGDPDKEGTWKFTIRAKDNEGKADRKFAIQVIDPDLSSDKGIDLVVDSFSLSDSEVDAGDRVTATIRLRNVGGRPAESGFYSLQWGPTRSLGAQLGSMGSYPSLSGDGTFDTQRRFKIPEGFGRTGTMFVGVVVDVTNTTEEKKTKGGTGENNNISVTSLKVSEPPPYKVLNPTKGAVVEPGKVVVISWQADDPGEDMENVRIALLQNGKRKDIIESSTSGPYRWRVPKTPLGKGFTIEVTSTATPAHWAESGSFSIGDDGDLSGTWRVRRKITAKIDGAGTDTDITNFDVEVNHDTKRNTADVRSDGSLIGKFTVRNGKMTATVFMGELLNGNVGNLFDAPELTQVVTNKGTFTTKRFSFTLKMIFKLTASQNLTVTFEFTGTSK